MGSHLVWSWDTDVVLSLVGGGVSSLLLCLGFREYLMEMGYGRLALVVTVGCPKMLLERLCRPMEISLRYQTKIRRTYLVQIPVPKRVNCLRNPLR